MAVTPSQVPPAAPVLFRPVTAWPPPGRPRARPGPIQEEERSARTLPWGGHLDASYPLGGQGESYPHACYPVPQDAKTPRRQAPTREPGGVLASWRPGDRKSTRL